MTIAERIKSARKKRGLTQAGLAQAVGVSSQAVSQWESGKTEPDFVRTNQIARALLASVVWLYTGEQDYTELDNDILEQLMPVITLEESVSFSHALVSTPKITIRDRQAVLPSKLGKDTGFGIYMNFEDSEGILQKGDLALFSTETEWRDGDVVVALPLYDLQRIVPVLGRIQAREQDRGETIFQIDPIDLSPSFLMGGLDHLGMIVAVMIEHRRFRR